jgi:glycosyltransferase involved in cell wall biosynthesis
MSTLTAVVATYERRDALQRLLAGLRLELEADPSLADDFDVVIVVDGSADGTLEMLEALDYPVPVKSVWQRNRGRSAARNAGLALAQGEIVWFLDDDLIPGPGLLRRHRLAHEASTGAEFVMGPYPLVDRGHGISPNERWTAALYEEMSRDGFVRSADRFASGNASGPAELFRSVGGFDEGFTGWGCEDVELAHRILHAGYEIRFDPLARAEHEQSLTIEQYLANNVSNGRNMVRAIRLHPDLIDDLLPVDVTLASRQRWRALAAAVYRSVPARSPVHFRLLASLAASVVPAEEFVTRGRTQGALYVAMIASTLAGIAEADPSGRLVARKLGIDASR